MPVIQKNYYLISHNDTRVEAWSKENIPFEPKGWQKEMKVDIREALGNLSATADQKLYAAYVANVDKFCDVENILLYNIGSGAFTNICGSTLCIERGFYDISIPQMNHYYKYELLDNVDFQICKPLKTLAKWDGIIVNAISHKPSFFWDYIKMSRVSVFGNEYVGKFGIEVVLETPRKVINLTSIVKYLLDGIICAFHQHNEAITNEILERISNEIKRDKTGIQKHLLDSNLNLLGKRNLVQSYRSGIKWNPADNLCVAIKLRVCSGIEHWKIDGRIFSI